MFNSPYLDFVVCLAAFYGVIALIREAIGYRNPEFKLGKTVLTLGKASIVLVLFSVARLYLHQIYPSAVADVVSALAYIFTIAFVVDYVSRLRNTTLPGVDSASASIELLKSDNFMHALSNVLPDLDLDKSLGLDSIPRMLLKVQNIRRSSERAAKNSLLALVAIGFTTAALVALFGFSVVDPETFGRPRELVDIRQGVDDLKRTLAEQSSEYFRTPLWESSVAGPLSHVQSNLDAVSGQSVYLPEPSQTTLPDLIKAVSNAYARLSKDPTAPTASKRDLESYSLALTEFSDKRKLDQSRFGDDLDQIEKAAVAEKANWDETGRIPDLIQRLAIGAVVSTFFLALVRFTANFHRLYYQAVLRADADDFALRRFLVAIKATEGKEAQRRTILQSFVEGKGMAKEAGEVSPTREVKDEVELLKGILSALAKRV